ncbi:hypothetical protein KL933_002199 [Ogataea haglerorum]|uniref:non-specific serine/threonine protein kinase n=1 Tax=Ogataea haglerorum TaxID=1937702 RepID=A0AAN6I172_9ASCO|nr:hypothetical protein KL914_004005 [Ogataea haglerorum]KAG7728073.1 hypothetical protein KL933_002199 [Ogataea haglerorum]
MSQRDPNTPGQRLDRPWPEQEQHSMALPKVRQHAVSRSGSLKKETNYIPNAAPATPRMLRSTSNTANLADDALDPFVQTKNVARRLSLTTPQQQNMPGAEGAEQQPRLMPGMEFNQTPATATPSTPKRQPSKSGSRHTSQQQQPQFHRKSIGDWDFAKTIGAGSMGKVKLARHRVTNEICAVKVVPRAAKIWQRQHMNDPPTSDPNELAKRRKEYEKELARDRRTIKEGALGRIIYHPYICRLYEMFSMTNHYYMLFEYVSGGQMLDYIVSHGSIKERQARKFCRGIASALDYCHSNNIVHRDLKIENIMISKNGDIKIIDFGLSNMFDSRNLLKTYCGSLYFAAPELLSAHPYIGPEVDVWSFGVVLYVLVCGKVPFDDQSVSALHEKIKRGNVEYPDGLSKECVSLMSRMLVVDPTRRATLKEVMNHPWMVKGFESAPSNYLPHRIPIELPLDPEVISTIVNYELGTEENVIRELTEILQSDAYQLATRNWYIKNTQEDLSKYDPTLPDPTIAYHPLISIYHLVDEMLRRKKVKEDKYGRSAQPVTSSETQQTQVLPPSQEPNATTPVLTFPQAAYTSPHQQSSVGPASQIQRNRVVSHEVSASPVFSPVQQQGDPQSGFTNNLFRKFSGKKPKNEYAPEELSPVEDNSELRGSRFASRQNDVVRRVGSMKITSKEKQQSQFPPLPVSSKQQMQHHQRATSAYTSSDVKAAQMEAVDQATKQKLPSTNASALPTRYHPTARAKSLGHARKNSLNIPKSNNYTIAPDAPPVPQLGLPSNMADDGFFDPVDMDEVTFEDDCTKPNRRLSDDAIISQFEHAPPGSMPSIEYPRTLFLKGFFSVQTTSTKPLPIIRYDIISVLPQLGVKFTEVKGGFVCVHYPSIVSFGDRAKKAEKPEKEGDESRAHTAVELDEVSSEDTPSKQYIKRSSLSSSSSGEKHRQTHDEHDIENVAERAVSAISNASASSKNGHRRKFSLGNAVLGGHRKQKEKLSLSTNVSNNQDVTYPTTPAPANVNRRSSVDSSESITFEEPYGGSDMLVSSRLEQENKPRSPSVANAPAIDTNRHSEKVSASKSPLKFEIHIVKVPLVGLYGVQFKKISGNTWLYKSLAGEILSRLNL